MMAVPQSPIVNNIFRPAAFVEAHPNLFDREGRLSNWLRLREQNGLVSSGAVFTKNKLLFIDAAKFVDWLKGVDE